MKNKMKLFNLTYENENYVSSIAPTTLPEDNYCLVEITYDIDKIEITSIKGIYVNEGKEKECILSDLNISEYILNLNKFLEEDIDKDKINLNFVEIVQDENERIKKIFIILLSSYLIYFNFLEFPFTISLDLLSNKMFSYFTSFNPTNLNEKSFFKQVSLLHRFFSTIFNSNNDISYKEEISYKEDILKILNQELDKTAKDIKEFKRKLLLDVNEKIKKQLNY